jgi:hypothetical protein
MTTEPDFTVSKARYAKRSVAVRCPPTNGFKTRAARLAEGLKGRYSNREHAYIMSESKARRLRELFDSGWDASFITGVLEPPRERL